MKHVILGFFASFLFLSSQAQFTKANLQATGLTCAMCSNAINKALKALPYVESVKPDIKNSSFAIFFKPSVSVDIDGLKNAVEKAGFSIGGLTLTGSFSGVRIANERHVQIGDQQFCFMNVSEQTLQGEETIKVVEKNFLTAREFKKVINTVNKDCLEPGKTSACCGLDKSAANTRIYHVTI